MLTMPPAELAKLCVVPDKTAEQFYSDDVKKIVIDLTNVSEVKAKLSTLIVDKRREFNVGLTNLSQATAGLDAHFQKMRDPSIKLSDYMSYKTYFGGFFTTYPYYTILKDIRASIAIISNLYTKLLAHPLLEIAKGEEDTQLQVANLFKAIDTIKTHIKFFNSNLATVPSDLVSEVTTIDNLLKQAQQFQLKK
jgi:hypothetical protein